MFSRNSFAFFYVRQLLLLAFVASWISCCVGCGLRPNPQTAHRELARALQSETVALVAPINEDGDLDEDHGKLRSYCAGTFVGQDAILTASHCVGKVGELVRYAQPDDLPSGYWTAHVAFDDIGEDLSVLAMDAPYPPHAHARVSETDIEVGDRVEVVGHPISQGWTYTEGVVSAIRPSEPNSHGNPMPTLQLEVPIAPGSSGGAAFDESGRLIGVCSYYSERALGNGWFVHRDAIRRFLARALS